MQWWYQKFVLPLQRTMNWSVWASFAFDHSHLNSRYNPARSIQVVGNDVTPTSLKKGRGEVVAIVVGILFHLNLNVRLVGGWMGPWTSEHMELCQMRKGGLPFMERARNRDFPRAEAMPESRV